MGYHAPTRLATALKLLQGGDTAVMAGGTDFFPALGEGVVAKQLLDITRIPDLKGISKTPQGWRIGATTTWTDIARAKLPACFDGLKLAARDVGAIQIQNAGTVAGNLCNASPAADGVPPLLTLDAQVEVASAAGSRMIALKDFIIGVRQTDLHKGELLTAIHIPQISDAVNSSFLKLGSRRYLVISIAMVAVVLRLDGDIIRDARIAVGACSPVAMRLHRLEAALCGANRNILDTADFITADFLTDLTPIDDLRGTGAYRKDAVAQLCHRALLEAANAGGNHG